MIEDLNDIQNEIRNISEYVNAASRLQKRDSPVSTILSKAISMLTNLAIDVHVFQKAEEINNQKN
jgi:hypothetical protein